MAVPIWLQITEKDVGWLVSIGDGRTRAAEGSIEESVVKSLHATIESLLGQVPAVVLAGRDTARTRREEAAGRALGEALASNSTLARRLAYLFGLARGRDESPILVVDSEAAAVRTLPWELLAYEGQPVEGTGGIITRLSPGKQLRLKPLKQRLAVLTWCPTAEEDVCSRRIAGLAQMAEKWGLVWVDVQKSLPDNAALILHIVCHGRRVAHEVQLMLQGSEQALGTATHVMLPLLRGAAAVVLDVCEGGNTNTAELDNLAGRFVAAGARAVAAPIARSSIEASTAFAEGFYLSLAAGETVAQAVAEGRRTVRALAMPHPDSRWCNFALYVPELRAVDLVSIKRAGWRPEGWPAPGADAADLLEAALGQAKVGKAGFVGIEHLLRALAAHEGGGPNSAHLRYAVLERPEAWCQQLSGLSIVFDREPDLAGTPRLRSYGLRLTHGFSTEDLWSVVMDDKSAGLAQLFQKALSPVMGNPGAATLKPATLANDEQFDGSWPWPTDIPNCLVVCGGPEDGRKLMVEPGDTVGRWSEGVGSSHELYQRTTLVDPFLSRSHLQWVGDGRIHIPRKARLLRGSVGSQVVGPGEVDLLDGDVLELSRATRLMAVHESGTAPQSFNTATEE